MSAHTDSTVGIDHPTVVPTNFSAEAADGAADEAEGSERDGTER